MNEVSHVNSGHLMYLVPLIKWRILDLESLREESLHKKNYFNFARIMRSLEKNKVINTYKHPFNKKKYIYLSPYGENLLGGSDNPTAVARDSLVHDIKVAQLARDFRNFEYVNEVWLEHQISNTINFQLNKGLIPDALIEVTKNKSKERFALELELTQKSRMRIFEKAKQYLISNRFDKVIYFFASENLMKTYVQIISDRLPEGKLDKFLFICNENLTETSNTLVDLKILNVNCEITLDKVFGRKFNC